MTSRTRRNMHDPTPDPYPDDPGDTRTNDEILADDAAAYRASYARHPYSGPGGDPWRRGPRTFDELKAQEAARDDEDSVTDDLATARRWFDQDGGVVVNEEDGVSYLHTFGSLPIYGVESYQRNGGGG